MNTSIVVMFSHILMTIVPPRAQHVKSSSFVLAHFLFPSWHILRQGQPQYCTKQVSLHRATIIWNKAGILLLDKHTALFFFQIHGREKLQSVWYTKSVKALDCTCTFECVLLLSVQWVIIFISIFILIIWWFLHVAFKWALSFMTSSSSFNFIALDFCSTKTTKLLTRCHLCELDSA